VARENVRFQEGNFTGDGVYFYSMLDGSQALQQKVDDGSVAFTFPLDTGVTGNIKELEWDGVYFWSLEDAGTGIIIRKWGIESFICKQQQIFSFSDGATHTYDADAFAVEHYVITVGDNDNGAGGYTTTLSDILVSDTSMLASGDVLTFVRKSTSPAQRVGTGFVEQVTVQSALSATQVRLTAPMAADPHGDSLGFRGPSATPGASDPPVPDLVYVTKYIWLNNKNSPSAVGTPALYKIRAANGSNIIQFSGTQYEAVGGSVFYTTYNTSGLVDDGTIYNTTVKVDATEGGRQTYLLIARSSTLLFFNVDTNVVDRSMVMNNIKVDTISVWSIYDMFVAGGEPNPVLYRLQQGTTYRDAQLELDDVSWSEYNYEKQLLRRVVTSIAVTADPSVIPATGSSFSYISATLRDQYNDVVSGKTVNWSEDGNGTLNNLTSESDSLGVARVVYTSGTTEQDVKVTAAITNGLV